MRRRQQHAVHLLRCTLALLFLAHAVVRLASGSAPQFGAFLEAKGLPFGLAMVYAITAIELVASACLIAKRWVIWASLGLMQIVFWGIVLIHVNNGWFVGEHGVGGMEYSVCLLAALWLLVASEWDGRAQRELI